MPEQSQQPHFIIDSDDDYTRQRLSFLESSILSQPDLFASLLKNWGEKAVSADHIDPETIAATATPLELTLIIEYFRKRQDADVFFDDATEDALRNDATHKELRQKQQAASTETKQTTTNAVRLSRLKLFVDRYIEIQKETEEPEAVAPEPIAAPVLPLQRNPTPKNDTLQPAS